MQDDSNAIGSHRLRLGGERCGKEGETQEPGEGKGAAGPAHSVYPFAPAAPRSSRVFVPAWIQGKKLVITARTPSFV